MNLAGWIVSIVGFGVLSLLRPDSGLGETVGFQFLMAAGVGEKMKNDLNAVVVISLATSAQDMNGRSKYAITRTLRSMVNIEHTC